MSNLYIMAGIPGAGKSTYAKAMFPHSEWVSSDDLRLRIFGSLKVAHDPVHKEDNNRLLWVTFHDRIAAFLSEGRDVVADATFLKRSSRERVQAIAEHAQAACHLILFKNIEQALFRNARREQDARVPAEIQAAFEQQYYDALCEITQEKYNTVTKIASFA